MNAMAQQRPKVLIVGAGFGGLVAAKTLARAPVDVTLIDRQNYHCFQPLLYQVATAALSPAEIAGRSGISCGSRTMQRC
jgi:NADH dehydrogenase